MRSKFIVIWVWSTILSVIRIIILLIIFILIIIRNAQTCNKRKIHLCHCRRRGKVAGKGGLLVKQPLSSQLAIYISIKVKVTFLTSCCAAHVSFGIFAFLLKGCYNVIIIIFYNALTLKPKSQLNKSNTISSTHMIGQWWIWMGDGREVKSENNWENTIRQLSHSPVWSCVNLGKTVPKVSLEYSLRPQAEGRTQTWAKPTFVLNFD